MLTCSSNPSSRDSSVGTAQMVSNVSSKSTDSTQVLPTKSLYQADQQVKFLHLQAEVESLLQQLKMLKQQKIAVGAGINAGN